ncbi:MAG TPA: DUF4010 domain-containing protein [Gemmatimonadales bacterium]
MPRAVAQLVAIAALYPIVPAGPIAALGGVRLRTLWIVVLLFSTLNFVGYLARRAVGPTRGYGLTGILGGLVSSTAVTFHFSRESRERPELAGPLGFGVVGACTVLLPRVLLASTALNPQLASELLLYLAPPIMAGAVIVFMAVRRQGPLAPGEEVEDDASPLRLASSLKLAVVFQLVFLAMDWVSRMGGDAGVITSAALVGLTDLDALTIAMSRMGTDEASIELGARAITVGVLSNTLAKLALTLALGSPDFRRIASSGLLGLAAACAAGLWVGWG